MIKLSAMQLCSSTDIENNLSIIDGLLAQITNQASQYKEPIDHLVVLPECCLHFGGKDSAQLDVAKQTTKSNKLRLSFSALAKKHKVNLVAGTIPILTEVGDKFTNSSCFFDPDGEIISQYDKIHLFDVTVSDATKQYQESRYTQAGNQLNVVNTPFANIGLSVCFDLRFPSLFQQLTQAGANIITVPSAFTKVTGKAHWQTLLQARAIENQVYIVAAGQEGVHENGRETWGHSMIINPWGEIEKIIETGVGFISVEYQLEQLISIRESMPLHSPFKIQLN